MLCVGSNRCPDTEALYEFVGKAFPNTEKQMLKWSNKSSNWFVFGLPRKTMVCLLDLPHKIHSRVFQAKMDNESNNNRLRGRRRIYVNADA